MPFWPQRKRNRRERDFDEEINCHLRMAVRDRMERGESIQDARAGARQEFGNVGLIKDVTREIWGWGSVERLLQDVRYAGRLLRKSPGFAAVAILSIALGVGANTAIFSLIDAVLLKSLPVRNPNELAAVGDPSRTGGVSSGGGRVDMFSYPFFLRFKAQNQAFSDVYATGRSEHLDVLLPNGTAATSNAGPSARFVTGNYFSVLGVPAILGRPFTEEEVRVPGTAPAVVISFGYWERQFGRDPNVIGQKLIVNGSKFTVIGVTPPDFSGDIVGRPTDIWFPITMQAQANPGHDYLKQAGVSWLLIMGRLKPGVPLAQASAETQVLGRQFFAELNKNDSTAEELQALLKKKIEVTPGAKGFSRLRHDFSRPLLTLMCIVGVVLLICCANVANLQLARAASRGREMGLRLAVGAGTMRLVRQLLTESLLLSIAGGVVGLFFAFWGCRLLLQLVSADNHVSLDVHLDAAILLFTIATAVLAGLLFGFAPALQTRRLDLVSSLKESKSGQFQGFAPRFGRALIVCQIVFSLLLLVGAGLFIRTLQNLERVDVGYTRTGLVVARVDPISGGYADKDVNALIRRLLGKLETLPGVESVSVSENGLFSGTYSSSNIDVEGYVPHTLADKSNDSDRVGPHYFETVGTPVIVGRGIESQDAENGAKVAVINEKMARFYFPNENPVGRHLFDGEGAKRFAITIVGVVGDAKQSQLRLPAPRRYYTPIQQHSPDDPVAILNFEIRTRGLPSSAVLKELRPAIKSVNANLPILDTNTADDLIGQDLDQEKLVARLSGFFGLLALALSGIGLYGVMSYLTVRRRTEIGIRMALGARRWTVIGMVLRETFRLVAAGIAIGLVLSQAAAAILEKSLFGLSAFDPLTVTLAVLVIILAAVMATYLPAWRASRIDPMIALRYE
ncbi:MAG: ABC transporter permease [Acidobacteriaceae bacterium]|nr:ABC transporter permease [Acidobacteriaceae bacterium]